MPRKELPAVMGTLDFSSRWFSRERMMYMRNYHKRTNRKCYDSIIHKLLQLLAGTLSEEFSQQAREFAFSLRGARGESKWDYRITRNHVGNACRNPTQATVDSSNSLDIALHLPRRHTMLEEKNELFSFSFRFIPAACLSIHYVSFEVISVHPELRLSCSSRALNSDVKVGTL